MSDIFTAIILGIPHIPTVTKVNVRIGPSAARDLAFECPLGVNTTVEDVQPDADNNAKDGKTYQWFKLKFPDNRSGWVRDDLIEILGNGTAYGYGNLGQKVVAFTVTRQATPPPTAATEVTTTPVPAEAAPSTPPTTTEVTTAATTAAESTVAEPAATQSVATTTTAPAFEKGKAIATCRAKTGVNMRPGPGTNYNPPVGKANFLQSGAILGTKADESGTRLKWIQVNFGGLQGWVREDFLSVEGDTESFSMGGNDAYPSPIPDSWWVRDYNLNPVSPALGYEHWGWDFGAEVGAPIYAGPHGGVVTQTMRCTKCVPGRESTVKQGISLGDPSVFSDAGWGYGYGHFVVVRYDNSTLPEYTKQHLAGRNLTGAHIFVLYGHLDDFSVQNGQQVAGGQQIAKCGNTGNSEGPHLHLEVRAGTNPNATWGQLGTANLFDPIVLFRR